MWFNRSDRQRRRRRPTDGQLSILRVSTRGFDPRRISWRLIGMVAVVGIGFIAAVVLFWLGLQGLGRMLFTRNDLFCIRDIKIECSGEVITPRHVMDYAELAGCSNLFAVNIGEMRRKLLEQPRLKTVEITRCLPGTLIIRARERVSLARLEMSGYTMTVDREGCVLGVAASGLRHLPVITGHGMPGLKPGVRLGGTAAMNALDVLNACESTPVGQVVKITRLDVRNPEALDILLADGENVRLAWSHMGERSALARENLDQKLGKLAETLKAADLRGKRLKFLDMTVENNFPAQ